MTVGGRHLFFGFLRDLDEAGGDQDGNEGPQAE